MSSSSPRSRLVPVVVVALAAVLLVVLVSFVHRAEKATGAAPLDQAPKPVTVIEAQAASFHPAKRYVGTIEPWLSSKIGPQFVSAYVDDVLVRPGAKVRRGDVLARLDCRNVATSAKAIEQQSKAAKALESAAADESQRLSKLQQGGFASVVETEQKKADAESRAAQLMALSAQQEATRLQSDDCVLRAPFDAEVADRSADPGTFARPGAALLTVVDRSRVRIVADVAEEDYAAVAPGTQVKVKLVSLGRDITGTIARRTPAADAATRTVRFEIDVIDPQRTIPVGTTADLSIDVGDPLDATAIPLVAASVKGTKANLFVVEKDVAHARSAKVLGEREGNLYVERSLAPGTLVVTEGRTTLADRDAVKAERVGTTAGASAVKGGM